MASHAPARGLVGRGKRLLRPLRHSGPARLLDRLEGLINAEVRAGRLPPYTLRGHVGPTATFHSAGREFFAYFRELAALEPHESVLDFGCGVGRMALPLEAYLGGSYLGIDPNRRSIEWCRAHIGARRPNFRFEFADMYNRRYNPTGAVAPAAYRLPVDAVDFAFATSVFTHLLQPEVEQFVRELGRVAGRALTTWFLVDGDSPLLPFADGPARYATAEVPEEMVGYERAWVLERLRGAGFGRVEVHPGSWRGDGSGLSYQDVVVAWRT
ncbi:MAG: methyltransferase domain-containing protein [Dehalococcoidia bacterium]|nr:methyltransferase domain-containing protein [Dehalococcoidia bacterium]